MNFIEEYLPFSVDYETANSTPKFQGNTNACTRFGLLAALKTMAERGGYVFDPSVRFIWYFSNKSLLSVESAVGTLNNTGVCNESLYPWVVQDSYPYAVLDLDVPPSLECFNQAGDIDYNVKVERIAGKEEVKRALAQGYCLIICRIQGPSVEHVEACIGYDEIKGMKIYGSGMTIYYEPWSSLSNGIITQVWKLYNTPWSVAPHPNYIEGTVCSIENDILIIPKVRVYAGWPTPSLFFKNIILKLISKGTLIENSLDVISENVWHSPNNSLMLPKVIIDGEVKYNVKLVNPIANVLQHEEDKQRDVVYK